VGRALLAASGASKALYGARPSIAAVETGRRSMDAAPGHWLGLQLPAMNQLDICIDGYLDHPKTTLNR
jgi:hypothetical protein